MRFVGGAVGSILAMAGRWMLGIAAPFMLA